MSEQFIKLLEANASLRRDVQLQYGSSTRTGDHMTVSYLTGNQEDVIVFHEGGHLTAKRLVRKMEFQIPASTYIQPTSSVVHDLADLDADMEKRLLKIYEKFPQPGAGAVKE
jgi:hypothetical protein